MFSVPQGYKYSVMVLYLYHSYWQLSQAYQNIFHAEMFRMTGYSSAQIALGFLTLVFLPDTTDDLIGAKCSAAAASFHLSFCVLMVTFPLHPPHPENKMLFHLVFTGAFLAHAWLQILSPSFLGSAITSRLSSRRQLEPLKQAIGGVVNTAMKSMKAAPPAAMKKSMKKAA